MIPNKILFQQKTINMTKDEYFIIKIEKYVRIIENYACLCLVAPVLKYVKQKSTKL